MNRSPRTESPKPARRRRVICVGDTSGFPSESEILERVQAEDAYEAVAAIDDEEVAGVWISRDCLPAASQLQAIFHSGVMMRDMPDGVALLDADLRVQWANDRLVAWASAARVAAARDPRSLNPSDSLDSGAQIGTGASGNDGDAGSGSGSGAGPGGGRDPSHDGIGAIFYDLMATPAIVGPDFCPFHTAMATGDEASSTLLTEDGRYYQVHAAPILYDSGTRHLIVTVSDVTEELLQQQKLAKIHQAGRELADLRPDEIHVMNMQDRIDLLKENIRHYLSDLLNFDLIEIRLLEQASGNLVPLLSVGLDQEAADRFLCAQPHGNGITGFAASSGESYLCHDVLNDPLFIPGVANSRSSLTVPLKLNDKILGTINIESPETAAFTDSDMQFLEIFSRDIAYALNTLELLNAQQADAAQQSCHAIHSAVAIGVDEILNDVVAVIEDFTGMPGEMNDRLLRVLRNSRDIKRTIHNIGEQMAPVEAIPAGIPAAQRAVLSGKRVLVVDDDVNVRKDAHDLLDRYGCIVETAHHAEEAVKMFRSANEDSGYNAVISDIRLPDVSGFQLMMRLKKFVDPVPMILMTGFGYDSAHSIPSARREGLHPKAVLYKPFRLDQLIGVLETVLLLDPKTRAEHEARLAPESGTHAGA